MLTLYIADVEMDAGMKKLSREEAAKVLEGMKVKIEIPKSAVTQRKRNTALDMAIEALKYSEIPNSSDCISRQAAIDAIHKAGITEYDETLAIEEIERVPPAQPERAKGEWVRYDGNWLKTMCKCSECGAMIDINEKYRNFFCYHCGADMRGAERREE